MWSALDYTEVVGRSQHCLVSWCVLLHSICLQTREEPMGAALVLLAQMYCAGLLGVWAAGHLLCGGGDYAALSGTADPLHLISLINSLTWTQRAAQPPGSHRQVKYLTQVPPSSIITPAALSHTPAHLSLCTHTCESGTVCTNTETHVCTFITNCVLQQKKRKRRAQTALTKNNITMFFLTCTMVRLYLASIPDSVL